MSDLKLWQCIGGPLHGQWRPTGDKPIATQKPANERVVDYAITNVQWDGKDIGPAVAHVSMAMPPRPVLYYPTRVRLTGWRIDLTFYLKAEVAAGAEDVLTGSVMPGGIVGAPIFYEPACRWCYGRPLPGFDVCSRVACINNVATIASLDHLTADDAARWGDRE